MPLPPVPPGLTVASPAQPAAATVASTKRARRIFMTQTVSDASTGTCPSVGSAAYQPPAPDGNLAPERGFSTRETWIAGCACGNEPGFCRRGAMARPAELFSVFSRGRVDGPMRESALTLVVLFAACAPSPTHLNDPPLDGDKTWSGVIGPLVATRCGIC